MPATIIGSPASGGKVLRRQNYAKETNGLETIQETYYVRTADLLTISPAKETRHSAFSSATTKYSRMVVETVSSNEMDGGIVELNVQYVGLTSSSGLPSALVRIIPNTGSGIFGPPVVIEAELVSDNSEFQILKGQLSSICVAPPSTTINVFRMPQTIHGTSMPANPLTPFRQSGTSYASAFYYRYEGYVMREVATTRRGLFNVAIINFNEYAVSISGVSGGFSKGIFSSS